MTATVKFKYQHVKIIFQLQIIPYICSFHVIKWNSVSFDRWTNPIVQTTHQVLRFCGPCVNTVFVKEKDIHAIRFFPINMTSAVHKNKNALQLLISLNTKCSTT
jgi:late competence protein required for DNA uptake (superfamily II DNA/RNA helicase)